MSERTYWGILHIKTEKCFDGPSARIGSILPWSYHGPEVFRTRREAREFIRDKWGYLKFRDDLKDSPHGWAMPQPVKIKISVQISE